MAYEGAHDVDARAPSWLGSTGTVLSLVTATIVGIISGNVGAGIMSGVVMYMLQRLLPGGMARAQQHTIHVEPGVFNIGAMHLIKPTQRMALPEIVKEEVNEVKAMRLRLRTRLRIIDVAVANEGEANTIIDAIGLKGARQVSAFLWTTPLPNWTELGFLLAIPGAMVLLASIYWSAAVVPIVVISALVVLLTTVLRLYHAEVEAAIGRDGITVRQGWLPPRFIRHASIASVKADKSEILVELVGGERMRFSSTLEAEPSADDVDRAKAIAERIEKDRVASAELPAAPPETPGLLRGPRSTKDWLDALRKLGEGGESAFRDAAPPRDQLWQIIDSIDAPAIERIAAAVALKTSGLTPEEGPRLRIAAECAVQPKLAERLRVVLSDEKDVKEEALVNVLEEAQKEEA